MRSASGDTGVQRIDETILEQRNIRFGETFIGIIRSIHVLEVAGGIGACIRKRVGGLQHRLPAILRAGGNGDRSRPGGEGLSLDRQTAGILRERQVALGRATVDIGDGILRRHVDPHDVQGHAPIAGIRQGRTAGDAAERQARRTDIGRRHTDRVDREIVIGDHGIDREVGMAIDFGVLDVRIPAPAAERAAQRRHLTKERARDVVMQVPQSRILGVIVTPQRIEIVGIGGTEGER